MKLPSLPWDRLWMAVGCGVFVSGWWLRDFQMAMGGCVILSAYGVYVAWRTP